MHSQRHFEREKAQAEERLHTANGELNALKAQYARGRQELNRLEVCPCLTGLTLILLTVRCSTNTDKRTRMFAMLSRNFTTSRPR